MSPSSLYSRILAISDELWVRNLSANEGFVPPAGSFRALVINFKIFDHIRSPMRSAGWTYAHATRPPKLATELYVEVSTPHVPAFTGSGASLLDGGEQASPFFADQRDKGLDCAFAQSISGPATAG